MDVLKKVANSRPDEVLRNTLNSSRSNHLFLSRLHDLNEVVVGENFRLKLLLIHELTENSNTGATDSLPRILIISQLYTDRYSFFVKMLLKVASRQTGSLYVKTIIFK